MTAAKAAPGPQTASVGHPRLDEGRGEWRDGDVRYLMLRADSLMGMFRRLQPAARAEALAALAASVAEAGGHSAARYREAHPQGAEAFLVQVAAVAARLGWGVWRFARPNEDSVSLEVSNSPFTSDFGTSSGPLCAPVVGMLEAVASLIIGKPVVAEELSCAAGGPGPCRFLARAQAL